MNIKANKNTEMGEIISKLNNPEIDSKIEAMRKIVGAMNLGQDVSRLFTSIIPHLETNNMHLKKLIYLYIINYAKSYPDLALLAINTFIKDCTNKDNPLLRGLAVRTMGCIRVKQITEHFLEALNETLKDEDAYVRKFAVITIAKIYDTNPDLIEEVGYLKILENMLNDKNSMVISNTIAALLHISDKKGNLIFEFNYDLAISLIISMDESNDWGKIYVLEAISYYTPLNGKEAQTIIDKILIYIKNRNSGVVLTCLKVVIKYLNFLNNSDLYDIYLSKVNQTLIDLLASEPEIQYIALKNINLLIQKNNELFKKQLNIFYCNYKDTLSVKIEKLDILVKLADIKNIDKILDEIKEYSSEVDIDFVKKCIRTIGLLAIKLEKTADKCVSVLWESIKNKPDYVIQEVVIVVKDIFRKYPGRYTKIIQIIFTKIKQIEDPETKSSLIWIVGEYIEIISNPQGLIMGFLETLEEETNHVQLQILTSCCRLYLNNPGIGQKPLEKIFEIIKNTENPDLRERGYFYWRMISINPLKAKEIICKEKKPISDHSFKLKDSVWDKLIENFNNLASIYYKLPTVFVKSLREGTNQRYEEALENLDDFLDDDIDLDINNSNDKINNNNYSDFLDNYVPENLENNKKSQGLQEIDDILGLNDNNQGKKEEDLLEMNNDNKEEDLLGINNKEENLLDINNNKNDENLMDIGDNKEKDILEINNKENDLLDIGDNKENNINNKEEDILNIDNNKQSNEEDLLNFDNNDNKKENTNKDDLEDLFGNNFDNKEDFKNIKIPLIELINEKDLTKSNNFKGLKLEGAFQKQGKNIIFELKFSNFSDSVILVNSLKINKNSYKIRPIIENLNLSINPNSTVDYISDVDLKGQSNNLPPNNPFVIDLAIILEVNKNQEFIIFKSPVSFSIIFDLIETKDGLDKQYISDLLKRPNQETNQISIKKVITNQDLIEKFENNNIYHIYSQNNKNLEMLSFYIRTIDEMEISIQVINNNGQIMIKYQVPHPAIIKLVYQAIKFIIDY